MRDNITRDAGLLKVVLRYEENGSMIGKSVILDNGAFCKMAFRKRSNTIMLVFAVQLASAFDIHVKGETINEIPKVVGSVPYCRSTRCWSCNQYHVSHNRGGYRSTHFRRNRCRLW